MGKKHQIVLIARRHWIRPPPRHLSRQWRRPRASSPSVRAPNPPRAPCDGGGNAAAGAAIAVLGCLCRCGLCPHGARRAAAGRHSVVLFRPCTAATLTDILPGALVGPSLCASMVRLHRIRNGQLRAVPWKYSTPTAGRRGQSLRKHRPEGRHLFLVRTRGARAAVCSLQSTCARCLCKQTLLWQWTRDTRARFSGSTARQSRRRKPLAAS